MLFFRLSVVLQPLNVVYKANVLAELKEFFVINEKSKYKLRASHMGFRFQQAFNTRIEELKLATKAEFENVVGTLTKGYCQVYISILNTLR